MPKKLTTEEFIEKANIKHKNKYDYSLVNYTNNTTKIIIICPEHGIFEQKPINHLDGCGCNLCALNSKINKLSYTTELFINKSNLIHNNKYDYSLTKYINNKTKIKIICPNHGEFKQTPNSHLSGYGCLKCFGMGLNTEEFIASCELIHKHKYDYSLTKYINNKTKIKIICPKHGEFEQRPDKHLITKQGCPICKESIGEKIIREYLIKNGISFLPQHKFKKCKNKKELPFDFYLPEYNICIEYNGKQHYKPINFFGGEKALIEQQKRDKIKMEYCQNNNITLIIIKENELIEDKLTDIYASVFAFRNSSTNF